MCVYSYLQSTYYMVRCILEIMNMKSDNNVQHVHNDHSLVSIYCIGSYSVAKCSIQLLINYTILKKDNIFTSCHQIRPYKQQVQKNYCTQHITGAKFLRIFVTYARPEFLQIPAQNSYFQFFCLNSFNMKAGSPKANT